MSFNRRFQNGISFGFNDTIGLYSSKAGARLQHHPDGKFSFRADQETGERVSRATPPSGT